VKVVIGLGNPGSQYERTRHNIGWMVLDRIADRAGLTGRQKARDASVTVRGRYKDLDLALVKPTTFMNLSGVAVRKVLARDHVPLEDMLVVVDDFDLALGRLRLREEGSAGAIEVNEVLLVETPCEGVEWVDQLARLARLASPLEVLHWPRDAVPCASDDDGIEGRPGLVRVIPGDHLTGDLGRAQSMAEND